MGELRNPGGYAHIFGHVTSTASQCSCVKAQPVAGCRWSGNYCIMECAAGGFSSRLIFIYFFVILCCAAEFPTALNSQGGGKQPVFDEPTGEPLHLPFRDDLRFARCCLDR